MTKKKSGKIVKGNFGGASPDALDTMKRSSGHRAEAARLDGELGFDRISGVLEAPTVLSALGTLLHVIGVDHVRRSMGLSSKDDALKQFLKGAEPWHGRQLFELVWQAGILLLHEDITPEDWQRVTSALAVMRGEGGTSARRRKVLRVIRDWVAFCEKHGWRWRQFGEHYTDEERREAATFGLISDLAEIDPSFAKLDAESVERLLARTRSRASVSKGGAGNTSEVLLAARLSVQIGAFGDDEEAKAKKRYLAAEREQSAAH